MTTIVKKPVTRL